MTSTNMQIDPCDWAVDDEKHGVWRFWLYPCQTHFRPRHVSVMLCNECVIICFNWLCDQVLSQRAYVCLNIVHLLCIFPYVAFRIKWLLRPALSNCFPSRRWRMLRLCWLCCGSTVWKLRVIPVQVVQCAAVMWQPYAILWFDAVWLKEKLLSVIAVVCIVPTIYCWIDMASAVAVDYPEPDTVLYLMFLPQAGLHWVVVQCMFTSDHCKMHMSSLGRHWTLVRGHSWVVIFSQEHASIWLCAERSRMLLIVTVGFPMAAWHLEWNVICLYEMRFVRFIKVVFFLSEYRETHIHWYRELQTS